MIDELPPILDMAGRMIQVNDMVVFASTNYNGNCLRIGQVRKVWYGKDSEGNLNPKAPRITLQPAEYDRHSAFCAKYGLQPAENPKVSKKICLMDPAAAVLVIPSSVAPSESLAFLQQHKLLFTKESA